MALLPRVLPGVLWACWLGPLALAAPPPKSTPSPSARELSQKGKELIKQSRLDEAQRTLRQCTALYPDEAACHLALGSAMARLGKTAEGAKEYREFLRLAPNDPHAPQVKKLLEEYEKSLK